MTITQWILFLLVVQVIHAIGTWKLYEKAGRKAWESIIPIYNAVILMKIINRPAWWTILLLIPVVNLIMLPVIWVETARSFSKTTAIDTVLAAFTGGLYIAYLNYGGAGTYRPNRSTKPTNEVGETISSILYAVVVATIIHTYAIQPFTIPTSSLEKTLLVGDYLFVSKLNYGPRTPKTPIAFPMVHDTIPLLGVKSYSAYPQLPKYRLPGFQKPDYNDIVVFNWPADTVYQFFDPQNRPAVYKPLDKRSNYVKRLVGKPGDNFSIKDGVVYIDGKELQLNDRAKLQYAYRVDMDGTIPDIKTIVNDLNVDLNSIGQIEAGKKYIFRALTKENADIISKMPGVLSVTKVNEKGAEIGRGGMKSIFPHNQPWSGDNLGPIHIPAKGDVVTVNKQTLPMYQRLIADYEGNDLKVDGGKIFINGHLTDKYTIQQDYYYMMGDNRHMSEDSRYWGFVPEDHIVGTPVLIWFSLEPTLSIDPNSDIGRLLGQKKLFDRIRWDRLFTTVHGTGQPRSYTWLVGILLAAWIVYSIIKWRKKKKKYF